MSEESNNYFELRQQILNCKLTPELTKTADKYPVYAAVVDMDLEQAVVSLACVADGTVSLYVSNGTSQLGLGHAHKSVRNAAAAFLCSSGNLLNSLEVAYEYPLPADRMHTVYLVTRHGIYKQDLDMRDVANYPMELKFLNFLYQNLLAEIGMVQTR